MDLDLGEGLTMRELVVEDAPLLVEATSAESEAALWSPRPVGPYSLQDAGAALSAWDPGADGQLSIGILQGARLIGAVGLISDSSASVELAYWIRPEMRRKGIATRAVRATTRWAHSHFAVGRVWLEIEPANESSLRLAQRAGYHFEQRLAQHCRDWSFDAAELDSWHDCLIWAHLTHTAAP